MKISKVTLCLAFYRFQHIQDADSHYYYWGIYCTGAPSSECEKSDKFCSEALILAWGSFTCRKSMTWDPQLYFSSEGNHTQNFYALKNSIDPGRVWTREPQIQGTTGVNLMHQCLYACVIGVYHQCLKSLPSLSVWASPLSLGMKHGCHMTHRKQNNNPCIGSIVVHLWGPNSSNLCQNSRDLVFSELCAEIW